MFALYKKELHGFFLSPVAYIVIAFFMMTFSLTFIMDIANASSSLYEFSFPTIFYVNLMYFVFTIPLLTMRSFAEERKNGTEILLLSSPVSVTKIVLAKFFATATVLLIMIGCSLMYPLLTAMMGKVVLSHLLCTCIGFFLFGMVCASLGILISSFTESPLLAIIISEAAMLLLILMDSVSQTALFSSIPVVSDILSWFSNLGKFNAFSQGLIRLSDLVGYLTEILLFLIWTVISVEKRRWSRR